ncbi:MAG TPA: phytoene/squalene synthase family protein [Verrucomicrobiae bacterium]|nr:phytoene/squalene synthase family protein [Verrucomicrobiae bacterium]
MSVGLEESYGLCCQVARRTAKNFYYSFLVMPREKRRAMCTIYAFMRRSDDIADGAANPAVALDGLRQWRAQVDAALNGQESPPGTPVPAGFGILPALADTVQRYRIPHRHFCELLDGTEMDQTRTRYETFDELYKYCYHVASVVGLIVLPVFGYRDETAKEPAVACGVAFQLTNILRDVKEDADMGRVYLPLEDLRRFGVSESDIMKAGATVPGGSEFHSRFVELMRFEAARAREFYDKARPLLRLIDADSRGTLAVMIGIYGGILDKIEARNFAVFDGRIRLSTAEKLWIVAKNWGRYS